VIENKIVHPVYPVHEMPFYDEQDKVRCIYCAEAFREFPDKLILTDFIPLRKLPSMVNSGKSFCKT
jgi:hypothetical protein